MLKKNYLWVAFKTLYRYSLIRLKVEHWWLWSESVNAMLMLAVFTILDVGHSAHYQTNQLLVIGLGLWVMTILTRGYYGTTHELMYYKLERVLENYVMSPLPVWLWLYSNLLDVVQKALLASLPVLLLLLLLNLPLPSFWGLLYVLWLLFLGITIFFGFGFAMALLAKRWNDLSHWDLIIFPILMLSGSFFDASVFPEQWRWVMEYNPFYQLQFSIRHIWFLDYNPIFYANGVLAGFALCSLIIAHIFLHKGVGLRY